MSPPRAPAVLSIDLALTSYTDIGAALLSSTPRGALEARIVRVPMTGRPDVDSLVAWIQRTSEQLDVGCVAIDGPLGWRGPDTDSVHSRLSERAVRAPGKTGLPPDGVKPRTYLAFSRLSIVLFERLTSAGWRLPADSVSAPGSRMVTETFPTAAWRALGLAPLPGKSRSQVQDVREGLQRLVTGCDIQCTGVETHDDLQAVVGGIAPAWWMAGRRDHVAFAGAPPFRLDESWREGFIILPTGVPPTGEDRIRIHD
jgi:hypothetical protein